MRTEETKMPLDKRTTHQKKAELDILRVKIESLEKWKIAEPYNSEVSRDLKYAINRYNVLAKELF